MQSDGTACSQVTYFPAMRSGRSDNYSGEGRTQITVKYLILKAIRILFSNFIFLINADRDLLFMLEISGPRCSRN